MSRLHPWRTGAVSALTLAILSIVCAAAVAVVPDGTIGFVNSWAHGMDLRVLRSEEPLTVTGVTLGVINVSLLGFFVGALFAGINNFLNAHLG